MLDEYIFMFFFVSGKPHPTPDLLCVCPSFICGTPNWRRSRLRFQASGMYNLDIQVRNLKIDLTLLALIYNF